MTTEPPFGAYYRLWASLARTESEHAKAHAALWKTEDGARVARLLTEAVSRSGVSEADRAAVLQHVAADWRAARNLASFAGSCTCRGDGDISARLKALREAAGLSVAEVADRIDVNRETVRLYEAGQRLPGWEVVQKLADLYGVPLADLRTIDKPAT